ncbi:MAG: redoxin domain-containing protein [Muribaculaceae bacterium]|nr:redoxin domain-containing protein [Muribaculaceae bacterium]
MKKYILFIAIAAVAMLSSCNNNKFEVDGKVDGATDSVKLVLETSSNGMWLIVDSVTPGNDGSFSISAEAPEHPNIYRLRKDGQVICFPIDSLDHITLTTTLKAFDTDYTLSGSDHAVQVMKIDKEAMTLTGGKGTPEKIKAYKDKLAKEVIKDPAGIVAYYIISKFIDDTPLFDPMDDSDLRIIGAVANSFNTYRPNDPRTEYLVNLLLEGQKRRRGASAPTDTIHATETSLIDMTLDDYDGKKYTLSQVAAQHKVVLLSFTAYQADFSPMLSKLFNDIYTAHKGSLEIYQVSLDPDNVAWMQAAKNLPWITVYDPNGNASANVGNYQVRGIPTTFIISNGALVERVEDANKLKDAVQKYL